MQRTMGSDRLPELQPETKGTHQVQQEELEALPPGVTCVTREELTQFVHTKRVASYLLGKTLGEGAFAKVKEGLHILTGEKVSLDILYTCTTNEFHLGRSKKIHPLFPRSLSKS